MAMAGVSRASVALQTILFTTCLLNVAVAKSAPSNSSTYISPNYISTQFNKPVQSYPSQSSHTYPSSGGFSGSGGSGHSYPSSNGWSGSGSGSVYPSRGSSSGYIPISGTSALPRFPSYGGNSGNKTNSSSSGSFFPSYSSSGGISGNTGSGHSYPPSNGMSGSGFGHVSSGSSKPVNRTNSTNFNVFPTKPGGSWGSGISGHNYPASNGVSGNKPIVNYRPSIPGLNYNFTTNKPHSTINLRPAYPSGVGVSSNKSHSTSTTHNSKVTHGVHHTPTTTVHHYNHYNPPKEISFSRGPITINYPAYRGELPSYVYEYKNSESKYRHLISGLALYNLGQVSANKNLREYHNKYKQQLNEVCQFSVSYDDVHYEDTIINCQMLTNYLWIYDSVTDTIPKNNIFVPNITGITNNILNSAQPSLSGNNQIMAPNGTLIPSSTTDPSLSSTVDTKMLSNGTLVSNSVPIPPPISTTPDRKYIGPAVKVTKNMSCYVKRTTPSSTIQKKVDCDLLEAYSNQSFNSAYKLKAFSLLYIIIAYFVFVW